MDKFSYQNIKNASIDYTFFKLNYEYHSYVSLKNKINLYSKSYLANQLAKKLGKPMIIY